MPESEIRTLIFGMTKSGSILSRPSFFFAMRLILAAIVLFYWSPASSSEFTALYDNERSGWDRHEPTLTPALLKSDDFGKLFDTRIDGQAVAQPLVVGSDVIVATEANKVYAIDSSNGNVRWETSLGKPAPSHCYAASPELGILSTPVIDPGTKTIYVMARVCDGLGTDCISPVPKQPGFLYRMLKHVYKWVGWPSGARYLLYALRSSDGHHLQGWPIEIAGAAGNDGSATFNARLQLQRPALLLLDDSVYAAFGGFCGGYPFRGWIAGVNIKTHKLTLWTDEAVTSERSPQAGIWGAGGLVSDGPRTILLSTGDGTLPPPGNGKSQANTLGNSVVRLKIQDDGSMVAVDHFTPSDARSLNDNDDDLGTASPLVLPDVFSAPGHRRLLLQVSKTGKLYLLDSFNLGGEKSGADGHDGSIAETETIGPIFTHPIAWAGNGGYFYVLSYEGKASDQGSGLRAFRLDTDKEGATAFHVVATSELHFQWHSGSPIITSNGTAADSAIVWIIVRHTDGDQLQAFSAIPDRDKHLIMLWNGSIGRDAAVKFASAATDSGRIFVATASGRLVAFGKR